ncbi:MAG: DMT family transporter [Mucilaginibacter sp.]|uniref:DMT family transporter n=1 Tax=Mucilaginibacter sp. TaxID=1882438 RepID=UPI00326358EC
MLSLILSFVASLSYGTGDFVAGRTARKLPSALIVLLTQGTQAIFVLTLALVSKQPFMMAALVWGIIGGIANGTAYMLYYRALTMGPAGVVSPIVASSSAIPVIVSLATGTIPNIFVLAGLTVILLGIIGTTYASKSEGDETIPMCRGMVMLVIWNHPRMVFRPATCLLLAIAAAICFGAAFTIADHGVIVAGKSINWMIWGFQLGTLPITLVSTLTGKVPWKKSLRKAYILKALLVIMLLNMAGDIMLAYAFRGGILGIVSVLGSLAPVVTTVLAALVLSEKLNNRQKISASLIVVGALIIAYWQK